MRQNRPISFQIASLDSLGQGVSKSGEKITFIPKTLPGEEGTAKILSEKKGVAFARLDNLAHKSPDRIESICPHFSECPSCHYLHTSYEKELEAKKNSFLHLSRKLPLPNVRLIPAPIRTGYRNRIQLHYDTKKKLLGMLDAKTSTIVPVPSCLIGEPSVRDEVKKLYDAESWLKLAPKKTERGHVEIYSRSGKTHLSWNEPYAVGGFTQVFGEMNQLLQTELVAWFGEKPEIVLDLFAGDGNLSSKLPFSKRLCVDIYSGAKEADFLSQSLYDEKALSRIKKELTDRSLLLHTLILDPPRSGLNNLRDWLQELSPKRVAYVSCDPHTLVRDLSVVEGYDLKEAVLLDFFPSTFHFETLIFLERK